MQKLLVRLSNIHLKTLLVANIFPSWQTVENSRDPNAVALTQVQVWSFETSEEAKYTIFCKEYKKYIIWRKNYREKSEISCCVVVVKNAFHVLNTEGLKR